MKKNFIFMISLCLCLASLALALTGCGGEKNPPGTETYTFASALTELDEVEGEGFSGGASGISMIAKDIDGKWKTDSGYYVTYLYVENTALTFEIMSDKAVDDAKLVLSLSAESDGTKSMTLTDKMYTVSLNDKALSFSDIVFYDIPNEVGKANPFKKYEIGKNLSLKEGKNVLKLISSNNISMGGTTKATAPMVDCVKITTSAKLTWTPKNTNLDQFA